MVASIWWSHKWQISPCCSSVTKSCLTLCNPMDCSMLDSAVLHHLLEFFQIDIHWCHPTTQPSVTPSFTTLNPSQCQGPFWWVSSSHLVGIAYRCKGVTISASYFLKNQTFPLIKEVGIKSYWLDWKYYFQLIRLSNHKPWA